MRHWQVWVLRWVEVLELRKLWWWNRWRCFWRCLLSRRCWLRHWLRLACHRDSLHSVHLRLLFAVVLTRNSDLWECQVCALRSSFTWHLRLRLMRQGVTSNLLPLLVAERWMVGAGLVARLGLTGFVGEFG